MANRVIIIAGPTASGKTNLAIKVALHFNAQIVSADSRQIYQELNIGVARPTVEELSTVKHHLIASHSIHQPVNASSYAAEARKIIADLPEPVAVVVGGTGLYIQALLFGLDEIPPVDTQIRAYWNEMYSKHGLPYLQQVLAQTDPNFFKHGEIYNPQRVLRALEVWSQTGKPISHFHRGVEQPASFQYMYFCLLPDRNLLYQQINARVDAMMQAGLWQEAQNLYSWRHLPVLQTIGYKELFEAMDGMIDINNAIAKIKQHTRNYAKRQITWFKNKTQASIVSPEAALPEIIKRAESYWQGGI